MDALSENSETGCCPRFDPEPWDEKEVVWEGKLFLKDRVRCFLHVPLNMEKVVVRKMQKIEAADARPPEPLMLSDCVSLWRTDLYIAVTKEIPGTDSVRISGTFLTKVYEGPYKDSGKWYRQMADYVKSKGREAKKLYAFYTTCPRCAKVYGKNYTVLFAKV